MSRCLHDVYTTNFLIAYCFVAVHGSPRQHMSASHARASGLLCAYNRAKLRGDGSCGHRRDSTTPQEQGLHLMQADPEHAHDSPPRAILSRTAQLQLGNMTLYNFPYPQIKYSVLINKE